MIANQSNIVQIFIAACALKKVDISKKPLAFEVTFFVHSKFLILSTDEGFYEQEKFSLENVLNDFHCFLK